MARGNSGGRSGRTPGSAGGGGPRNRRPGGGGGGGRGYTGGTGHRGPTTGGCMLAKAVGAVILAFIATVTAATVLAMVSA